MTRSGLLTVPELGISHQAASTESGIATPFLEYWALTVEQAAFEPVTETRSNTAKKWSLKSLYKESITL